MFYEEKIINGIPCWRSIPNGEWIQKTPDQLTQMLTDSMDEITSLYESAAGASILRTT